MSTPDLSKIVELIMQNPGLISEIQGLVKSESNDGAEGEPMPPEQIKEEVQPPAPVSTPPSEISPKLRRAQLLSAMKPYVSSERAKAIDSMLSISEILDVMKVR